MEKINVNNYPQYRIDNEYETWRTDKQYWIEKYNEIINAFKFRCADDKALADLRYKLHKWQAYVNMIFDIHNCDVITVSFDFNDNTLNIHMNEELQKLFD